MANIDNKATTQDLTKELARVLHSYPLSSSNPVNSLINFNVYLFKSKSQRGRGMVTQAKVTIPSLAVAEHLLQLHGGLRSLHINGRSIRIFKSRNPASVKLLEKLRNTPFLDPAHETVRIKRLENLSSPIKIASLGTGRLSGSAFFLEYDQALKNGEVTFDGEKRLLQIRLKASGQSMLVSVRFYTIESFLSFRNSGEVPSILLILSKVPTFELVDAGRLPENERQSMDDAFTIQDMLRAMIDAQVEEGGTPLRQRKSSIDLEHARVSPFTSNQIILRFPDLISFEMFRRRRTKVHLPRVTQVPHVHIVRESLYSTSDLDLLATELKKLDLRIAFQIESLLYNKILHAKDIIGILITVRSIATSLGVTLTERILSVFAERLVKSDLEGRSCEDPYYEPDWDAEDEDPEIMRPFDQINAQRVLVSSVHTREDLQSLLRDTAANVRNSTSARFVEDQSSVCRHVVISPTSYTLEGPYPDRSNSILRKYPSRAENFIRVSVRDEDYGPFRSGDREVDIKNFLEDRYLPILTTQGLQLCGRRFEFLAYSSSGAKSHSVWFMAPFIDSSGSTVNSESIRKSLGDFSGVIKNPARFMARLAQSFSSTLPSISLKAEEIRIMPDIINNGFLFTDGCGTISSELANEVDVILTGANSSRRQRRRVKPTCYQIRIGGAKGMISIDPTLVGRSLYLRPSMNKFDSGSLTLDIATSFSRPLLAYLNRPLIKILEDLQVEPEHLLKLQDNAVKELERARSSILGAATLLDRNGLATSSKLFTILRRLRKVLGIDLKTSATCRNGLSDTFVESCISLAVTCALKNLKFKARIPLPDCWNLVGIADESGYLEEKEIYAAIKRKGEKTIYLEGPICISRSPCVFPGDVQTVHAVGKLPDGVGLKMRDNTNCVVFSVKGDRSLPSFLGNGDLDGDLYQLITIPEIIPATHNLAQPAAGGLAVMNLLDRPCTIADGAHFFLDFILNDMMGVVATEHLATADQADSGVFDKDCLLLAKLHSAAVDFPKSGTPVSFAEMPRRKESLKPDFMYPEYLASSVKKKDDNIGKKNDDYYQSKKVLGRLFRSIPLESTEPSPPPVVLNPTLRSLDGNRRVTSLLRNLPINGSRRGYLGSPDESLVEIFTSNIGDFGEELMRICRLNTISRRLDKHLSEEEAFIGTIMTVSKDKRRRQDAITRLEEQTESLFEELRYEISGEDEDMEIQIIRAWAAWNAGLNSNQEEFGVKTYSWLSLGLLLDLIVEMNGEI